MKELERVEGIGTKTRQMLEEAGIETLRQLAKMEPDELCERVEGVTVPQAKRWIEGAGTVPAPQVRALIAHRPLYRLLTELCKGQRILKRDQLHELPWCDEHDIDKLVEVGAISRVSSPPLAHLPDWEGRAGRLIEIGISTVIDLRNTVNVSEITQELGVTNEVWQAWVNDAMSWIEPPKTQRG